MSDKIQSRKDPFWVVEVGDDPEDEKVYGPYSTFIEAMIKALTFSYYVYRLPKKMKKFRGIYWNGQISGLYLVQNLHKPDYNIDLRNKH